MEKFLFFSLRFFFVMSEDSLKLAKKTPEMDPELSARKGEAVAPHGIRTRKSVEPSLTE